MPLTTSKSEPVDPLDVLKGIIAALGFPTIVILYVLLGMYCESM